MRCSKVDRKTNETDISVSLNLDGVGKYQIKTGIGFFDHMLEQLSRHSLINLELVASGDLEIDDHHTVEDVGICLGIALKEALENKSGIKRFGSFLLPMDDALIQSSLDISGRPYLNWRVEFSASKIGNFDTELLREFFYALSQNAGFSLHVICLQGKNSHHIAEAIFKSVAKSLRIAVEKDERLGDEIPSTKGSL
tara:strand:- start:317 stop:904 length:588 start_codon:yes stop_codon:yes gene_type:complete